MKAAAALARQPAAGLADGLRTHLDRLPIDEALAARQHRAYVAALEAMGVAVTVLPPLDGFPDGVFVEDAVLAFAEAFVLTRPGALERAAEPDAIAVYLPPGRPVLRLAGGRIDGGDVLRIGKTVFVGLSSRTDTAGAAALAEAIRPFGYNVDAFDIGQSLHLKTAVTALDAETLLANPSWVTPPAGYHVIACDPAEPFGANIVAANGKVLAQGSAPRTAERIAAAGYDVASVDVSEFAKAEAGLTCMSVLIPD